MMYLISGRAWIGALGVLLLAQPLSAQPGRERGTPIAPGESCPPGMTEIRPRNCQAPEVPAPSILDYRPRSTLVAPAHVVPKAKYPVIDFHGHPRGMLGSPEDLAELGRVARQPQRPADDRGEQHLGRRAEARRRDGPRDVAAMKDRVRVLTGINFRNVGPGWAERAIAQLEADVAAGAVGVGEIGKGFGLSTRKADGSRLALDDPELEADLGGLRPAEAAGVHPHRRSAGVLPADRLQERALARAGAVPRPSRIRPTSVRPSTS